MKYRQWYGVIYVGTCSVNGKQYVGQTTSSRPERYIAEHTLAAMRGRSQKVLYKAIRKHGKAAFTFEIVWLAFDKVALDQAEDSFISLLGTIAPRGYNLRGGGAHGKFSEESKAKMSLAASRPENRQRKREALLKILSDPEIRKKVNQITSIRLKKRLAEPGVLAAMYAASAAAKRLPENRAKVGEQARKYFAKPGVRELHSARVKAGWTSEKRKIHGELQVQLHARPGSKEKRSASLRASHSNPEVREKIKVGADISRHVRWHAKRGIVNPNCWVCVEYAPSESNDLGLDNFGEP